MKVLLGLLCALFLMAAASSQGATISGVSTSSDGTFTLTWPSPYKLRPMNGSWQFPGTTSEPFSNLPSGEYKFGLHECTVEPEQPPVTICAFHAGSEKTVTVTRDNEPAIDASTTAAGTTAYQASTSLRGSASIDVPIRTLPGINGLAPSLALRYDSGRKGDVTDFYRADDTLGYGWYLDGASTITRCRGGLSGGPEPLLNTTDRLCLDGQPLLSTGGTYWNVNTEYRTEQQSFVKVINKGTWFEVRYPDGRVANYGDSLDSKVVASGRFVPVLLYAGPNAEYMWAIRQVTNGFGDTMTYAYDAFPAYGMLQLKSISYGGATVELKYGPRSDLLNVSIGASGGGYLWRQAYLHTIRMRMNGVAVREYRLDSNSNGGYLRLEQIQECGYDEGGSFTTCLKPLLVGWTAVSGGASPISLTSLVDGRGAVTEFAYTSISTTTNPTTYAEAPFGSTTTVSGTGPRAVTVVHEMKTSDGLTSTGRQRTTYAYKGLAYASTLNRGYLGFYEARAKNEQSGVYSYTQTRLDFPFAGLVAQNRVFTGLYGSGTELEREEHAYAVKVQTGSQFVHPLRSTRWILEGAAFVGASETSITPCYRVLSGDVCPGSGTELETPTQFVATTVTGNALSNDPFTPGVWGDVPDRTVSSVEHTKTETANLQNTTTPWVIGAPIKTISVNTSTSEPTRTVTSTASYVSGTRELLTQTRLPGDATLQLMLSRTFTGNNLTSETTSGSGFTARSTNYGPTYVEDRYPASVTDALSHATNFDYDLRFGSASIVTDPDGNQTNIELDAFGRTIRTTQQDGTEVAFTYERCDVADCSAVTNAHTALRVTVETTNGATQAAPTRVTYVDVRGRGVLTEVEALSASDGWRRTRTEYDVLGRTKYTSIPYFSSGTTPTCTAAGTSCTWFTYDIRDRVVREDRPDGGFTTTTFAGAAGAVTVTVTETVKQTGAADVTRAKQSLFNALSQLTSTTDAYGTGSAVTTTYDYDSLGNLDTVLVGGVSIATMGYDLAGNRTNLTDANLGAWSFEYDALGNQTRMLDAKSQDTRYTYDLLSRLTQRIDRFGAGNAVTNSWNWDAAFGTGQLESRSAPGFTETYSYQAADSKLASIATDVSVASVHSGSYTRTFGYDSQGRLSSMGYPSGHTFTYAYNAYGYLTQVKDGATVLENVQDTDAFGSPTVTSFNNTLKTTRGYDPATGRLTSIQTGTTAALKNIQDLEYQWRSNSALFKRIDHRNTAATTDDYTDTFSYDAMERLTQQATTVGATRTLTFGYDSWGNLTTKPSSVTSDLSVTLYTYGTTGKPHRLNSVKISNNVNTLSYDGNGNITTYDAATANDTFLTYDGQNNVTRITVGTSDATTTPAARDEFWYDPDGQRFLGRESWNDAGTQKNVQTVYLGNFEEVIPAAGDTYNLVQRTDLTPTVRQVRTRTTAGVVAARFEYIHRDHLGSIDAVTNASGTQLSYRLSFDPYGRRRKGNWGGDTQGTELTVILAAENERHARGFTDHEQLNRTGFIHMNGRVFDPRIGRFVSADPIVQAPTFSQSFNRYSYVFNNPLSFTDPSGFEARPNHSRCIECGPSIGSFVGATAMQQTTTSRNVRVIADWVRVGPVNEEPDPQMVDANWGGPAAAFAVGTADLIVPGVRFGRNGMAAWSEGSYLAAGAWSALAVGEVALAVATYGGSVAAIGAVRVGAAAARGLPNAALVARGGNAANQSAARINAAIGPSRTPGVSGFSAQCNGGTCLSELGKFIPNKQLGVTTVGEIRAIGGDVIATPGFGSHVTVTGVTGEAVSPLFRIFPNPNPLVVP